MHEYVIFNGELLPASEAKIPAVSPAALYGQGVFTTLAIYNNRPFLWKEHWKRIKNHAERVGVDCGEFDETMVLTLLKTLIEKNDVQTGRARISFLSSGNKGFWKIQNVETKPCYLLITTGEANKKLNGEIEITSSSFPVFTKSPLAGIKSCNYLESIIALDEARENGFSEAVRVNEKNQIVSACMANIFWVKGNAIFTPDLKTGTLDGTTKDIVIRLANNLSIPVGLVFYEIGDLYSADEIFLTSSGIGVCLVKRFGERVFSYTKESLAWQLREAYKNFTISS